MSDKEIPDGASDTSSELEYESLSKKIHAAHLEDKNDYPEAAEYEQDEFEDYEDESDSEEMLMLNELQKKAQMNVAATKPNKTFNAREVRKIERDNMQLMERILSYSRRPSRYKVSENNIGSKLSSAAINRRKHQEKINRDNQILLKKIQSVKPVVKNSGSLNGCRNTQLKEIP